MEKSIFCGRNDELAWFQREWRLATEADGHPQVVVLLGDNGLGKTRIVQEFFGWLSTTLDAKGAKGYWPDELEVVGDNLECNPAIDPNQPAREPPFLWWGFRFYDVLGRNAASAGMDKELDKLAVHLDALSKHQRRDERIKRSAGMTGDATLDGVLEIASSAIPHIGLAKTGVTALLKGWGLVQDHLRDRPVPSLGEIREREQKSKAASIVDSIRDVVRRHPRLPICIFADDAHFSDPDPDTVDLLQRLLDAARADRWPLLLVITHWRDRWNGDASAVARWLKPQAIRIATLPLDKLRARTLAPMLAQYFLGLLPHQSDSILDRADGNPQFLDEIVRHMDINRRLFVNRDKAGPLTGPGFAEIMHLTVERHRLNARRFHDLPDPARAALAVGSLQGQRLLQDLTTEVCIAAGFPLAEVQSGIGLAEMPHNLIKREGAWAEFLQQLYREIAEQDLDNVADRATVHAGIVAALRRRIADPDTMAAMNSDDRLATLGIAWTVLRNTPGEADSSLGATAAALLIAERFSRRDFLGAGAQARALVDAMRARMAH